MFGRDSNDFGRTDSTNSGKFGGPNTLQTSPKLDHRNAVFGSIGGRNVSFMNPEGQEAQSEFVVES